MRMLLLPPFVDAPLDALDVGDEQVVAHELHAAAQFLGQRVQPSQSFSASPSSMDTMGKFVHSAVRSRPCPWHRASFFSPSMF